jgi:hypothetical protein
LFSELLSSGSIRLTNVAFTGVKAVWPDILQRLRAAISKSTTLLFGGSIMFEEVAQGAGRIARAAVTGMFAVAAAAAMGGFATDANAQTPQPRTIAATRGDVVVPQDVCAMTSIALNNYVRANISKITDPADRAQLGILAQWVRAGCQGTVRLQNTREVFAATTFIQGVVGTRYNLNNAITLG